jgi:hypothetical protein
VRSWIKQAHPEQAVLEVLTPLAVAETRNITANRYWNGVQPIRLTARSVLFRHRTCLRWKRMQ